MWKLASVISSLLLVGTVAVCQQDTTKPATTQDTSGAGAQSTADTKIPADAAKMVSPTKPTAAGIAHAKKLFGYNCAMCHGKDGDGQGDLADQMKLKLKDWRDPTALKDMTDGELFYTISKGRGQMPAGADQMKPEEIWAMVHYVRSFAQKTVPVKAKT